MGWKEKLIDIFRPDFSGIATSSFVADQHCYNSLIQEIENQIDGQRILRGDVAGSIAYHIAVGILDQQVND